MSRHRGHKKRLSLGLDRDIYSNLWDGVSVLTPLALHSRSGDKTLGVRLRLFQEVGSRQFFSTSFGCWMNEAQTSSNEAFHQNLGAWAAIARVPSRLLRLSFYGILYNVLPASLLTAVVARFIPEKVKRHAALVLGNICQTDAHRAKAGEEGAVEGLFALCDSDDGMVRANALWALGNLAWDPWNQVIDAGYTRPSSVRFPVSQRPPYEKNGLKRGSKSACRAL